MASFQKQCPKAFDNYEKEFDPNLFSDFIAAAGAPEMIQELNEGHLAPYLLSVEMMFF